MKTKKVPLYFTIKKDIINKIQNHFLLPGDILPTENQLCKDYNVSRVTIRRAIEELIASGMLERQLGQSARVSESVIPRSLNNLTGLHEELETKGIKCSSFILSDEIITTPPSEIISRMNISEETPLQWIERLRYANGKSLCYQTIYLNTSICGNIDSRNLVSRSLYKTLITEKKVNISTAEQTIEACLSDHRVSALLELPQLSCLLKVSRTAYDSNGKCFEYSESSYIASRYKLSMTLGRHI